MLAHLLLIDLAHAEDTRLAVAQRLELYDVDPRSIDARVNRTMNHMCDEELLTQAGRGPDGDALRVVQAREVVEQVDRRIHVLHWHEVAPIVVPHRFPGFETCAG